LRVAALDRRDVRFAGVLGMRAVLVKRFPHPEAAANDAVSKGEERATRQGNWDVG
jgi:hypothetical protein